MSSNFTRSRGYRGHSLYVDGYTNRVNLDANNTDYLEQSFDGRTVSIMLKPDVSFYTGPKVVGDDSLAAYYTFDNQTGIVLLIFQSTIQRQILLMGLLFNLVNTIRLFT